MRISIAILLFIASVVSAKADDKVTDREYARRLLRLLPKSTAFVYSGEGVVVYGMSHLSKLHGPEVLVLRALRGRPPQPRQDAGSIIPPRCVFAVKATDAIVKAHTEDVQLNARDARAALLLVIVQEDEAVKPPLLEKVQQSLPDRYPLRRIEEEGRVLYEVATEQKVGNELRADFVYALAGDRTAIAGPKQEVLAALDRWDKGNVVQRFRFIDPSPIYWLAVVPRGSGETTRRIFWDRDDTEVDEKWLPHILGVRRLSYSNSGFARTLTEAKRNSASGKPLSVTYEIRLACKDAAAAKRFVETAEEFPDEARNLFPPPDGQVQRFDVNRGKQPDVVVFRLTMAEQHKNTSKPNSDEDDLRDLALRYGRNLQSKFESAVENASERDREWDHDRTVSYVEARRVLLRMGTAHGPRGLEGSRKVTFDEAVIKRLIESLKDRDDTVRRGAAGLLSISDYGVFHGSLFNAHGDKVVPALVKALQDENANVRRAAAKALEDFPDQAQLSVSPLEEIVRNFKNEEVVADAANALAKLGEPGLAALRRLLADEMIPTEGRTAVAWALDYMEQEAAPAVPELIELLDSETGLKRVAIYTLGAIGREAKPAIPKLMELLNDSHEQGAAAKTLGDIGLAKYQGHDIVAALISVTYNSEQDVRIGAIDGLHALGPAARAALPRLVELIASASWRVRLKAIHAAGHVGVDRQQQVRSAIEAAVNDSHKSVRRSAELLLKWLDRRRNGDAK